MEFIPDKYQVICITNKRFPIITQYKIHQRVLATVKTAKYLGVNISDDLSWTKHIHEITQKANNLTSMLRRNISTLPSNIKEKCYQALVRPTVEYASTVWDPTKTIDIDKIEFLQRRAARFVKGDYRTTSIVTCVTNGLR